MMLTMNHRIQELLETIPNYDIERSKASPIVSLEGWLGLDNSECSTIEDEPALPPLFWDTFGSFLVWAYHLPLMPLEKEDDFEQLVVVKVTKWFRHCLDLNMVASDEQQRGESSSSTTFSAMLLSSSSAVEPLTEALYHHVQRLSQLQSVQQIYIQTLRQNSVTVAVNRLEAFQEMQSVSERLQGKFTNHLLHLECILGDLYATAGTEGRSLSRQYLATYWHAFAMQSNNGTVSLQENTRASGIAMTLRFLLRICKGTPAKLQPSHRHLLFHSLLPLHQPDGLVLWRDQTALLDLYHEPLVQCMAVLLQKEPTWLSPTLEALMHAQIWTMSNTPKIILLLHEVDTFLQLLVPSDEASTSEVLPVWPSLLARLCQCMSSDNSRLSERSLQFFRKERFQQLFDATIDTSLPAVLKAIIKPGGELPWNPTVRKMTYNVMNDLYGRHGGDDEGGGAFGRACRTAFDSTTRPAPSAALPPIAVVTEKDPPTNKSNSKPQLLPPAAAPPLPHKRASKAPDFSVKAGMGDWRPPKRKTNQLPLHANRVMLPPQSRRTNAPPSAITGVAPWSAVGRGKAPWASGQPLSKQPPLTVTGVAPWAVAPPGINKTEPEAENNSATKTSEHEATIVEEAEPPADENQGRSIFNPFLGKVLKYMEDIKPPLEETGASTWSKTQMAESPTLLPSLKFHDLVFGHELGAGAFGSVRYARLIDQSKTRSHWAEYAVKNISTQKIVEMGYESSVQREIATLRVLSHPCIARLISSFRFRDGAYLVLEYASKGDLHMLLRQNGSLDHESTQFVVGEIVAALSSIHELGFVYGDLKTENTVITETGHIKLTDFGACRPVTPEAKELIQKSAKNLLKELRDGDWKPQKAKKVSKAEAVVTDWSGSNNEEESTECIEELQEDDRIEGTTAYLPPEVVLGAVPTRAADMWALGCLLYQCLTGRPPLLSDDDESTRHRIVTFDQSSAQRDGLFCEDHAKDVQDDAKNLIRRLLSRNMLDRPAVDQVVEDSFFAGKDVLSLYLSPAHPLDVGTVAPVADAKWGRRQLSSIWAPQPKAYDISLVDGNLASTSGSTATIPIQEGGEASSFFSYRKELPPGPLHHVHEHVEA
jgi:serine/threonine protein kinase